MLKKRPPLFVVKPAQLWDSVNVQELIAGRHVFWALLMRNVRMRYRQTLLGPLWYLLVPLIRMILFSAVLGYIAGLPSDGVPYPIFTYTALLPWELFAEGVRRSSESLVRYQHIVSKVYFPRLMLPVAEVGTALMDFLLSFLILLAMALYYGFSLTPRLLLVPFLVVLTMAFALMLGLMLANLHARLRDTKSLLGYVLQFWLYATPVAYAASVALDRLPEPFQTLYRLNPMYLVVEGFRWSVLQTGSPPGWELGVTATGVFVGLFVSVLVFRRSEHSIVDLL